MFDAFRLLAKVLFAPIWLLWKLYLALWWAFDDSDEAPAPQPSLSQPARPIADPDAPPAPGAPSIGFFGRLRNRFTAPPAPSPAASEAGSSFSVVDSRPPKRPGVVKPLGLLRTGFASTLVVSLIGGLGSALAANAGSLSTPHAWTIFAWAGFTSTVLSLMMVRSVARKRREIAAQRYANIKAAWACAKDGCAAACTSVRKVATSPPAAACGRAARACAVNAAHGCAALARRAAQAAASIGKVTPATQRAPRA